MNRSSIRGPEAPLRASPALGGQAVHCGPAVGPLEQCANYVGGIGRVLQQAHGEPERIRDGWVRDQEPIHRSHRVLEQLLFHTVRRIGPATGPLAWRRGSGEDVGDGLGQALPQALGVHGDSAQVLRQFAGIDAVRALLEAGLPVPER